MDRESDEVHSDEEAATSSSHEVMISRHSDSQVAGRLNTSSLSDGSISVGKNRIEEGSTLNIGCQEVHQHFHTTTYNNPSIHHYNRGENVTMTEGQPNLPREIESSEPVSHFKKADKSLQQTLRKAAHIASTTSERPPLAGTQEKIIEKVPIEIAVETDHIREGAHSKHSKAFFEAKAAPESRLAVEDLLPRCLEKAKNKARLYCHSDEAKEQYIQQHGNIVSIIGDAGIGKTAFSKTLAQKLLNESLTDFDYIFYIPIRKINFDVKTNLLQFLMKSASCSLKYSKLGEKDIKEIFEKLDENPGVVIILDGLDEASLTKKNVHHVDCDSSEEASAESFIKSLLSSDLLPKAKKFVTSRPNQLYDLPEDYRPQFIVRILGLSKASQEKLCVQICGEKSSDVLQYLYNHPELNAYCYVPFNCILTMSCICEGLTDPNSKITFNTMTGILAYTFLQYTKSSHVREKLKRNLKSLETELKKLCDLAWLGHTKKIFIFEKSHLDRVGISDETMNTFLHIHLNEKLSATILEGEKQKYFPHLLWQEFFSAIHLILFMLPEQFEEEVKNFSKRDWEKVIMFMFGLHNNKILKQLNTIFSTTVSKTPDCSKKSLLKSFALKLIPNQIYNNEETRDFFRLCLLVYETQDDQLRNEVAAALPSCITLSGSLHSTVVNNLLYIFNGRAMLIQLNLELEFLQDSFKFFFPEICKIENIQIKLLDLKRSAIGDDGARIISYNLNKVEKIDMVDCGLTEVGVKALRDGIRKLKNPIKVMRVSYTSSELAEGRNDFEISWDISKWRNFATLLSSPITGVGVEVLCELISQSSFEIPWLVLTIVKDTKHAAVALSSCLHKLNSLSFLNTDLMQEGSVACISDSIKALKHSMHLLEFVCCKIGDEGVRAISSCLDRLNKLKLLGCGVTGIGMEYISKALTGLALPIKYMNLTGNNIGDDGTLLISSILGQIEELDLSDCGITEVGVEALRDGIKKLKKPIKLLKFSYILPKLAEKNNKFRIEWNLADQEFKPIIPFFDLDRTTGAGVEVLSELIQLFSFEIRSLTITIVKDVDRGLDALSSCAHKIQCINILGINEPQNYVQLVSDSLQNFTAPINSLKFSNRLIADDGAKALSTCLAKIKFLDIYSCGITDIGMKYISEGLKQLSQPIKYLNLTGNDIGDNGARIISSILGQIEGLYMNNCGITEVGVEALRDGIKKLEKPMKLLSFSYIAHELAEKKNKFEIEWTFENGAFKQFRCGIFFVNVTTGAGIEVMSELIQHLSFPISLRVKIVKDVDRGLHALSTCAHNIKSLDVIGSDEPEDSVRLISDSLKQFKDPINSLQFGNRLIADDGAKALSTCLAKIKSLYIYCCGMTDIGMKYISEGLKQLSQPIKYLNLTGNDIGDNGARIISSILGQIEKLCMNNCGITEVGVEALRDGIKKLEKPIRLLSFSYIAPELAEDKSKFRIVWNLNHLEEIGGITNSFNGYFSQTIIITGAGIEVMSELIQHLSFPISLRVNIVKDVDRGLHALSTCAHNIKSLDLIGSDEPEDSVRLISDSLKQFKDPINSLKFGNRLIADDGVKALSTCLAKIKSLDIYSCGITDIGMKYISEGLKQLSQPMKCLDVSGNCIGDDGARIIASNLSQVEELHMKDCGLTEVGVEALRDGIKQLKKPMTILKISYIVPELEQGGSIFEMSWDLTNLERQEPIISFRCIDEYEHDEFEYDEYEYDEYEYDEYTTTGIAVEMMSELIQLLSFKVSCTVHIIKDVDRGLHALSTCADKIKPLNIVGSTVPRNSVRLISDSLLKFMDPISSLRFSGNKGIDDSAVEILSSCLTKVDALDLSDCSITERGMEYLSDAIRKRQNSMKCLDVSGNCIGDDGARIIASNLSQVEELHMKDCGLTEVGVEALRDGIKKLEKPMTILEISYIVPELKQGGNIFEISWDLTNSKRQQPIISFFCNVRDATTGIGVEMMSELIQLLSFKVSCTVHIIKDVDRGLHALSTCADKIKPLNIVGSTVPRNSVRLISDSLLKFMDPISSLIFSGNKGIDDSAVKILSSCLTKVDALDLSDCSITERGVEYLSDAIRKRQNSISLQLDGNSIGDKGADHLSSCLDKIDNLSLKYCGITSAGVDVLSSSINKLSHPMKFLRLDGNIIELERRHLQDV